VVVFVDEIESTLGLPFTDDFFAAVRAAYNARASDPAYKRLTFVLLGVVRPADLIKDRSRTPYNIGLSIDLKDFTLQEANALLPGLETASVDQAQAVLKWVLHWTGGHPYLTQKMCAEVVAARDGRWTDDRVARLVGRLFLSDEARKESNLQFVRDRVHESRDREKLLRVYRQVLSGRPVPDEERDPVKSQLKLVGLLHATPQGRLTVRNRIYEMVFDAGWIKDAMPRVTSTRVTVVSIVVALIALVVGAFLIYHWQNRDQILAQTYEEAFLGSESAPVRVNNLAGLFQLGGEFALNARELFFGLPADQQLAMFTDLTAPEEVGQDLQTVVRGLYTHLENDEQHDALLQAMSRDVEAIKAAFPDSSILCAQIGAWLEGRAQAQAGDYEEAVRSYDDAIEYGGQNPAIYLDRASAYVRLERYGDALTDLARVVEQDPERQERVVEGIQSNRSLHDYLMNHQADFPTLAEAVK